MKNYSKKIFFIGGGALMVSATFSFFNGSKMDFLILGYWIGYTIAYFFSYMNEKDYKSLISISQEIMDLQKLHIAELENKIKENEKTPE